MRQIISNTFLPPDTAPAEAGGTCVAACKVGSNRRPAASPLPPLVPNPACCRGHPPLPPSPPRPGHRRFLKDRRFPKDCSTSRGGPPQHPEPWRSFGSRPCASNEVFQSHAGAGPKGPLKAMRRLFANGKRPPTGGMVAKKPRGAPRACPYREYDEWAVRCGLPPKYGH